MTSTRIALTADQALSHASRLLAAGGDVTTSRSVTSGLAGGDTADAEKTFHLWLQERATDLGIAAIARKGDRRSQSGRRAMPSPRFSACKDIKKSLYLNASMTSRRHDTMPSTARRSGDGRES